MWWHQQKEISLNFMCYLKFDINCFHFVHFRNVFALCLCVDFFMFCRSTCKWMRLKITNKVYEAKEFIAYLQLTDSNIFFPCFYESWLRIAWIEWITHGAPLLFHLLIIYSCSVQSGSSEFRIESHKMYEAKCILDCWFCQLWF